MLTGQSVLGSSRAFQDRGDGDRGSQLPDKVQVSPDGGGGAVGGAGSVAEVECWFWIEATCFL